MFLLFVAYVLLVSTLMVTIPVLYDFSSIHCAVVIVENMEDRDIVENMEDRDICGIITCFDIRACEYCNYKSDVIIVLKYFIALIENQFYTCIKTLRSDNGMEILNKELGDYLKHKGIVHQTISHYTPQQNGLVERKHKHLLEVARAWKLQVSLPKVFW